MLDHYRFACDTSGPRQEAVHDHLTCRPGPGDARDDTEQAETDRACAKGEQDSVPARSAIMPGSLRRGRAKASGEAAIRHGPMREAKIPAGALGQVQVLVRHGQGAHERVVKALRSAAVMTDVVRWTARTRERKPLVGRLGCSSAVAEVRPRRVRVRACPRQRPGWPEQSDRRPMAGKVTGLILIGFERRLRVLRH